MSGWLRRWLAGFGDPQPNDGYLPDKVVWTREFATPAVAACAVVGMKKEGWTIAEQWRQDGMAVVRAVRFDGAYRWRDDGFKGY